MQAEQTLQHTSMAFQELHVVHPAALQLLLKSSQERTASLCYRFSNIAITYWQLIQAA
jgi:hypothetical protein